DYEKLKPKTPYPYQHMDDSSPGQLVYQDAENLPKNPDIGTMYFDSTRQQVLIWVGDQWMPVDNAGPEEEVIKEWEVPTNDEGWVGIRIFESEEGGKRRIIISNDEGHIVKQGLENVLEYIKNNTDNTTYLHSESRIFEYFS
ncbi:MAG: hypothetical protein R3250_11860, partial [Melioribacteraceae bacterium]|nr:hypothetical protein [Melioribacteraceae bacterium]